MDNHSACSELLLQATNSLRDLQISASAKGSELVNNLGDSLKESLHIQDIKEVKCNSDGAQVIEVEDRNVGEGLESHQIKGSKKSLGKSATFPCTDILLPPKVPSQEEEDPRAALRMLFSDEQESVPHSCSRSISLPVSFYLKVMTPLKLVSAMKGGRAQQGVPPMKMTVKWAPDVYDPPQTLLSHTVQNKKQNKYKNNKKGRKWQKGSNSSRGSGGKEKRQVRKVVRNSDSGNKSFNAHEGLVDPSDKIEFDVGDTYCGGSFLKNSVTMLHYSVAEAL